MKWYDVSPLSQEWRVLRLGCATSSSFSRIITPKTMKLSSQAPKYMAELLAEWISGEEIEGFESEWMTRGQDVEDQIWKAFEFYSEVETSRGGYFCTDDGMLGCSPDRLIGGTGDLEAKAPMLHNQILRVLSSDLDETYKCQIQGRLMIHERERVELFSWHPKLVVPPVRIYRDDKFIDAMRPALTAFVDTLLQARLDLESRFGPFVRDTSAAKAEEFNSLGVTDEDVDAILAAQAQESLRQGGYR